MNGYAIKMHSLFIDPILAMETHQVDLSPWMLLYFRKVLCMSIAHYSHPPSFAMTRVEFIYCVNMHSAFVNISVTMETS
jgi:hypothetical protein